ncbi:hypothetical protein NQ176_g10322 [Zarea fungicola]|uniref:Uncharacterized protein n=1 Tax=Zarea fungicola TaxID=93591 RepID=A0ACC1MHF9_9HYPO|nr:hypothetical protein NQ176_g10322 [Lecanicillium fungicola]
MSTHELPASDKLLIQMSGAPGSGKSTVATILRQRIGGVVINHDVIRSSLLESSMPFAQAAEQAYRLQWALAGDVMKQDHNIIIDSTCNYQQILDQGAALAEKFGYTYWYVECKVEDIYLLDQRLRTRVSMASQRTGVDCPPAAAVSPAGHPNTLMSCQSLFKKWIENPSRPEKNGIVVDSTGDPDIIVDGILQQVIR